MKCTLEVNGIVKNNEWVITHIGYFINSYGYSSIIYVIPVYLAIAMIKGPDDYKFYITTDNQRQLIKVVNREWTEYLTTQKDKTEVDSINQLVKIPWLRNK